MYIVLHWDLRYSYEEVKDYTGTFPNHQQASKYIEKCYGKVKKNTEHFHSWTIEKLNKPIE
jgi:hypothetical protein